MTFSPSPALALDRALAPFLMLTIAITALTLMMMPAPSAPNEAYFARSARAAS